MLSLVFSPLALGAYPSMVKAAVEGRPISVTEALGKAYHRFWTLLAASILVGAVVVVGTIALVVPGVIFGTWYAYTFAAVMLEDKGTLEGMAASKAFGRDKKGDTFLVFLAIIVASVVLVAVETVFSLASPLLGQLVYAILYVPVGAWISVILAYTYLAYGPSSVGAATEPGKMPQLIRDIRDSFKAKGLEFVSLTESPDPKKTVLTYNDGSGNTLTKEILVQLFDLEEAVRAADVLDPTGLADYLLGDSSVDLKSQ